MNAASKTALGVALKFLATSERFEQEVRFKLQEFEPDEVEQTIAYLKGKNLINDRRAAEALCRTREGRRAVGSFRMEQELKRRGASEEIVSELCQNLDEAVRAATVLASKFSLRLETRPDPKLKDKAFRFLLSRGFGYETAHNAIRDFFAVDV